MKRVGSGAPGQLPGMGFPVTAVLDTPADLLAGLDETPPA